ncbi:ankyrin, partial [Tuber magnatum]
ILIAKGNPSLLTAPDQHGNTPLHEAATSGHWPMLACLVKKFEAPEYKKHRDQIDKQNNSGDTPLHLAFQFDHPDIVEFLVRKGADLAIENNQGVTALQLGEGLGREDSLDILRQA